MSRRSKSKSSESGLGGRLVRGIFWMLAAGAWVFVFASLLSFDPADPPSHAVAPLNPSPSNLCGLIGAYVAFKAYAMLGPGIWVLMIGIAAALSFAALGRKVDQPVLRTIGLVMMALAVSAFVRLILPEAGPMPEGSGGMATIWIVQKLNTPLSHLGTMLVFLVILAIGLLLCADELVMAVPGAVARTGHRLLGTGRLGSAFTAVASAVWAVVTAPWRFVVWLFAGRGDEEEEYEDEEYEDEEEEYEDEAEYEEDAAEEAEPAKASRNIQLRHGKDSQMIDTEGKAVDPKKQKAEEKARKKAEREKAKAEKARLKEEAKAQKSQAKAGSEKAGSEKTDAASEAPGPQDRALDAKALREKIKNMPISFAASNKKPQPLPQPKQDLSGYKFPGPDLLEDPEDNFTDKMAKVVREQAENLEKALHTYGIDAEVVAIDAGPVITLYEVQLAPGTKVSQLNALSSDLARELKAQNIRIVANTAGKSTVGIEVPNLKKEKVRLKELMSLAS
ncbi:MAG: DNA translocase FtsK 4TM domain-containing protein, partial [Phycisphaeraceae bacterium]|nr:DNA translocase FtsK 4TM domain-containing protein [Phycisphaeraceae bacterium]